MLIKFTKPRYYGGKLYKINDVIEVSSKEGRAYINIGSAVLIPPQKRTIFGDNSIKAEKVPVNKPMKTFEEYDYRTLQKIAKENGISGRMRRTELVKELIKKQGG